MKRRKTSTLCQSSVGGGGLEVVDLTRDETSSRKRKLADFFPSVANMSSANKQGQSQADRTQYKHECNRNGPYKAVKCSDVVHVTLEARKTNVSGPISASIARAKFTRLASRDTCSSKFVAQHVFDAILHAARSSPSLPISDAILNQEIFPGVGNIIKIEGLHQAKIDPRRHLSSLCNDEVKSVVRHCHKYSMGWLKSGRAPEKCVYNRTSCGTCGGATVSMQKVGGAGGRNGASHTYMSRVTFWCRLCQPLNSSMPIGHNVSNQAAFVPLSNASNESSKQPIPQQLENGHLRSLLPSQSPPFLRTYSCPEHGPSKLILRRVRKEESPNRSRLFRACQMKGCSYFSWADSHFPLCSCRKKTILRVSKTERSGGRWFLSCANGAKSRHSQSNIRNGCEHFEWAQSDHLTPFGVALTPLL